MPKQRVVVIDGGYGSYDYEQGLFQRHGYEFDAFKGDRHDRLGKIGESMLPFYRYMVVWKDLYRVHGGEVNWAAEGLGVIGFTNELFTTTRYAAKERKRGPEGGHAGSEDGLDRERRALEEMRFGDRVLLGEFFSPWKPYRHPVHGPIEIGGRRQMVGRVPPAFMIEEMLHRNTAFAFLHADQMPQVELEAPIVTRLGPGLFQVDATAVNDRLIPTRTRRMITRRIGRRDLFELVGGQVVAGGFLHGQSQERFVPVEKVPHRLWRKDGIGSHGRVHARWLVRGPANVRVVYDAEKGGRAERSVQLGP